MRCCSFEGKPEVWAISIAVEGLGARAREDLGWDFQLGCSVTLAVHGQIGRRTQIAMLASEGLCCPLPTALGRGEALLLENRPGRSCCGETLPSSGLWAGELNEEAPADLVWDLPETRINRETLEILRSCGWQL